MVVQIKTLLVKLARESCLACLGSLQERISILQERPTELDMFMAYQVGQASSSDYCFVYRLCAHQFPFIPAYAFVYLVYQAIKSCHGGNLHFGCAEILGSAVWHRQIVRKSTGS